MPDVEVTELLEIDPERVDAVLSPANGTDWLILKALDDPSSKSLGEICDACNGESGHCAKCRGTGLMPQVGVTAKELVEAAKARSPEEHGVAASGVPVPLPEQCPTCAGSGEIGSNGPGEGSAIRCPDCGGSGKDSQYNTGHVEPSDREARATDGKFSVAHADEGSISEGDPQNREKVDKGVDNAYCDDSDCDICKELFDASMDEDDLEKKKLSYKDRKKLPKGAFALPGRRYPIHDLAHARNALARVSQNGTPEEQAKVRAAVHRRYPGIQMAEKSEDADVVVKDGMVSGPNPFLSGSGSDGSNDSDDSDDAAGSPGSPEWEAQDAETATAAATALMAAAELIGKFRDREAVEVAAGEGSDLFDTFDAQCALDAVTAALGIIARLAFHEGMAAAKSTNESEVATKSGKRLSTKSVAALVALRDHLSELLGDDDPAHSEDHNDATKSIDQEVIEVQLTTEEFDTRVASAVVKALTEVDEARKGKSETDETEAVANAKRANAKAKTKDPEADDEDLEDEQDASASEHQGGGAAKGKSATDEAEAVASAKRANSKAKTKKPKAEDEDLEDEATQGTNESASSPAEGAAKAEGETDELAIVAGNEVDLTPEVIEANEAAKAAKKEAKRLRKAAEQAAINAATAKAIEEAVTKATEAASAAVATATEAVKSLQEQLAEAEKTSEERLTKTQERLDTVEKMAAPSTIVRTRPVEAAAKSAERDALELELTRYENMSKATSDLEYRRECTDRAKALRVQIAALNS